ncbi:hypothetical protein HaLaN_24008, partial [Haematococcus lacustris]
MKAMHWGLGWASASRAGQHCCHGWRWQQQGSGQQLGAISRLKAPDGGTGRGVKSNLEQSRITEASADRESWFVQYGSSMREEVLRLAGPAYNLEEEPGAYVRRLEAACQLLHLKLKPSSTAAAQTTYSCPSTPKALPAAPPTPSTAGNTAAVELCTLLLTDQEVLDVVLALHDIRIAQLWNLLPWSPHCHTLYSPLPSESLDQQLRHSQRSVPGSQLSQFISRLERSTRME